MEHIDDQMLAALVLEDPTGQLSDLPDPEFTAAQAHLTVCEHCSEEVVALRERRLVSVSPAA